MTKQQTHINVTQDDIDKADVKNSSRCVVARAVARTIPDATRISVDVQSIRFTSGGERRIFLTPYAVAGYVVAFDAGEPIHPFTFRLRNDQEMKVRRSVRTPAGKAKATAAQGVRNAKRNHAAAAEKAAAVGAPASTATPQAKKAAHAHEQAKHAAIAEAETERDAVMAAYQGARIIEPTDTSKPMPIPKVFKRGERVYGMRLLKVNQS